MTITGHFGSVFGKSPSVKKSRDYRDVIVFKKLGFKIFSVHTKMQSRHFQIPPLENVWTLLKRSTMMTLPCRDPGVELVYDWLLIARENW